MTAAARARLHGGALAVGLCAAIALLVVFHATVSDAVAKAPIRIAAASR